MPIVIDKEQKKRAIALACKKLLVSSPVYDLTISQLAKEAQIGKGTFYEYFANKEELLFTLVEMLMAEYNVRQEEKLLRCSTAHEKIKCFAEFFYREDASDLRMLYKSFVAITLLESHEKLTAFQTGCLEHYYTWFEKLIEEGIEAKEFIPESKELAKGLFAMAKGMFVISETTYAVNNLQHEIDRFLDTLFVLISTQKDHDASKA